MLLRECTMALACGVNLTLAPDTGVVFKQAGMLAIDGRCKTLDADADGYVRGEACGVLLLDGEGKSTEFGGSVVCFAGSAVNQDGRSSALTAPNGPAQQKVISSAMQRASLTSTSVAILNMHGTGTPLGDPIEIGAAHAVLMQSRTADMGDSAPLSVQAGKTYVGHTEPAAGVVGLIHAVHGTCHRMASPVLHLRHVNPHLTRILGGSQSGQGSRLGHLCRERNGLTWNESTSVSTHASGVSAFAFQGTNAHALVRHTMVSVGVLSSWSGQHWQNQRFWVGPVSHPLVLSALPVLHEDIHVCTYSQLMRPSLQWIWDHRVMGRVLFPGAGFMETACALMSVAHQGSLPGAAVHASITAPLMLPALSTDDSASAPLVYLESKVWCLTGNMQIGSSSNMSGQSGGSIHMRSLACRLTGELVGADIASHSRVSVDCTRSRCQGPVDWSQVRKGLALVGLQYGPQFSGAWNVRVKAGETAQGCMKSIPNALPSDHNETGMMVHPAALDGCLQLGAVMHVGSDSTEESSEGAYVPAGFGAFSVPQKTHDLHVYALAESVVSPSASGSVVTNHVLQMKGGLPVAVLSELEAKQMGARPVARAQSVAEKKDLLYEVSWQCDRVVLPSPALLQGGDLSRFTVLLEQDGSAL